MALIVGNISRRRVAGVIVAGVVLLVILVSGFSRVALTDAAWSDERTLTATFEIEKREVLIPGYVTDPRCEAPGGPPNEITLTWDTPATLADDEVDYEVAWRVAGSTEFKVYEVDTAQFGPYSPDLEPTSPAPDLEFFVQAKIKGSSELGPAVMFWVKGPRSNGLFTCNGKVEFRALPD